MIKQEIRDKFDIPQHAVLFALIYRAAVELYGRQGAQRADNGTKVYGYQRGMRMAQRAVKDKQPLNMRNYLLYGRVKDKSGLSKTEVKSLSPVYATNCTHCGWCQAWQDAGLLEYGKNYCTYVDKSLVKGFNRELSININSVLSQGGDVCRFEWLGSSFENSEEAQKFFAQKPRIESYTIKDFLYHTAHLLNAMFIGIQDKAGLDKATKIREKAMADFRQMYGDEMADAVRYESMSTDFSKI